jgi:hypothetical protein
VKQMVMLGPIGGVRPFLRPRRATSAFVLTIIRRPHNTVPTRVRHRDQCLGHLSGFRRPYRRRKREFR